MPVSKRANGSWRISFYRLDGSRFEKTLPAAMRRAEVETLEARYRLAERGRPARERRGLTVGDLFARYWSEHGQHLASAGSERAYLDAWADRLGDATMIEAVAVEHITAAVAHWRSTPERSRGRTVARLVKPATINHRLRCLQRIWRRAADLWGLPVCRVPWGRLRLDEPLPVDRSVPYEALLAYFAALPPRSRWPSLLAFNTGLRRGGVLRITRADLDFERRVIHTVSKGRAGGKPTPVPMTDAVLAVLAAMGPLPEVGAIFPVIPDQLRRDRQAARKVAGLPDLRFHDLRHAFASDLADRGLADLIPEALHHSDPRLARRYGRPRIDRMRERMNRR